MERDKIKRYYIMPEVWVTVTQSQVFNWVKLVNEGGISTDCISITTNKLSSKEVIRIEESIGGRFYQIRNNKRLIINDLYLSCYLLKYYLKSVRSYEKVIFQTRMAPIGLTFAFLKWLPNTKFIFEARAAKNEELKHQNDEKRSTLKNNIKNYFNELSEKLVNTKSDGIFCVSSRLKDYYLNKYALNGEKFHVFPGAADSELFYFSESLREKVRMDLNLGKDEIWIVYSGRLEMKWEIPDKLFIFFEFLFKRDTRFRLMILTPDVKIASDLITKHKFENIVYLKEVALNEVNNYLNAADAGILLREDITMNHVASPTKFAEYVMSGLPVIISKGVCDFAGDVLKSGYGSVVSGLEEMSEPEYEKFLKALKFDRKQISKWGMVNFSKESFIKKYTDILQNI